MRTPLDVAGARTDLPTAARALRDGRLRSVELVDACLARAAEVEPWLHAFAWLEPARIRAWARERDAAADRDGALHGVPVAVKDIFDTAGVPTEHGSALFAGRVPGRSAAVVRALERAGGVVFGKTVTAELAFYRPGPTVNPHDPTRTPGGSSMGSAAAVAAGVVPASVGSQTNGSIVRPAAFCGVVGFKPSHGALSTEGVLAFAPTLDTVGVFARSVAGAVWLAAALAGDPPERWSAPMARPRFALARTSDFDRAEPAMRERFDADVAALASAGARIERPDLPAGLDDAIPVQRTIMAVEAARSLGADVARAPERVSAILRDLLDEGRRTPAEDYERALAERRRLVDAFAAWAAPYDAVLTIPAPGEAPPRETTGDPRFCTRWTLVGAPAFALPTGRGPRGLPLGIQLVGAPGSDARTAGAAAWTEERIGVARGLGLGVGA